MKKILLIDDMQGIRDSLEVILASKYELDVLDNATDGLSKVASNTYDLIITDIIMPGMDGNEFMIQAKKHSSCPILAISAGGNGTSPDQALLMARQQASGVLEKPFSKNELIEKIEALIG
jgi:DNA-binding NtrC family response regulator